MRMILNFFSGGMFLAGIAVAQNIDFTKGSKLNSIVIKNQHGDDALHFYSAPKITPLILTHWRRDAISNSNRAPVQFVPQRLNEKNDPPQFWKGMAKKRFHYYAQQSTKVLVEPLEVKRWVKDGDLVKAAGVKFQVIATPGYTRGSFLFGID